MTYLQGEDDVNDDGGRIREAEVDPIHHTHGGGGEYVKLRWGPQDPQPGATLPSSLWFWVKLAVSFLCLGLLALVVFIWVGPFLIEQVFLCLFLPPKIIILRALIVFLLFPSHHALHLRVRQRLSKLRGIKGRWKRMRALDDGFHVLNPPKQDIIIEVIIPLINWERNTFSSPELAVLVFASVALFPTLLLPSSPSMWVAGMTFGYVFGFLLITSAAAVGVSLPFFIGSIFHHKIEGWLDKYPKRASVLRSAGGGNWFHQFRAVALIRISPFPYIIYNYCSVATNVKYGPYLFGSLVGMVPEIFVSIYTGILIQTLANASHKKHTLSAPQIVLNVVGFCITVATIIFFTVYAKRRLKELQKEDELLLQ